MPLYEYECEACGHRFEVIQKFSDAPVETCPACGGAVRKLLSSPAIQFKGSGWYITDYARKGKTDSDSGKSTKESTKSDSSGSSDTPKSSPASDSAPSSPASPPGSSTKQS
jgi:putative FmdB family regulatory protein